jgi:hypothetical protein
MEQDGIPAHDTFSFFLRPRRCRVFLGGWIIPICIFSLSNLCCRIYAVGIYFRESRGQHRTFHGLRISSGPCDRMFLPTGVDLYQGNQYTFEDGIYQQIELDRSARARLIDVRTWHGTTKLHSTFCSSFFYSFEKGEPKKKKTEVDGQGPTRNIRVSFSRFPSKRAL